MSPKPRSRQRFPAEDSNRRLNPRLNLLLVLVVVQILLSIVIILSRYTNREIVDTGNIHATTKVKTPEVLLTKAEPIQPEVRTVDTVSVEKHEEKPSASMAAVAPEELAPVKVQVLNGCGIAGIAAKVGKWLEKNGYNVEDIGNADRQDYQNSGIIDRSGNLTAARELALLLGIGEDRIKRFMSGPKPQVDLTLIVGKDCKRLPIGR